MVQLWNWTPRPTRTRLLHDVAAKPAVLSTPVNDQVLIYTPESREASSARNSGRTSDISEHFCCLSDHEEERSDKTSNFRNATVDLR